MKNRRKNKPELKSYLTYDELEQLGFGSWLKKNAGIIGTVAGGVIGSALLPGVGTQLGASIGGAIGGAVQQNEADKEAVAAQNLQIQQQNATAQAQAEYQRLQNANSQKTFTPLMEDGGNINKTQINNDEVILQSDSNTPSSPGNDKTSSSGNDKTSSNNNTLSYEEKLRNVSSEEKTLKNAKLHYFYDNSSKTLFVVNLFDDFENEEEAIKFGLNVFYPKNINNSIYRNSVKYLGSKTFNELKVSNIDKYKSTYIPTNFNQFLITTPINNVLTQQFKSDLANLYKTSFPIIYELFYPIVEKINSLNTSAENKRQLLKNFYDNFIVNLRKLNLIPNDIEKNNKAISDLITSLGSAVLDKDTFFQLAQYYNIPEDSINNLINTHSDKSVYGLENDDLEKGIVQMGQRVFFNNVILDDPEQISRIAFKLDPTPTYYFSTMLDSPDRIPYLDLYPAIKNKENNTIQQKFNLHITNFDPDHRGRSLIKERAVPPLDPIFTSKINLSPIPSNFSYQSPQVNLKPIEDNKQLLMNIIQEIFKKLGYDKLYDGTVGSTGVKIEEAIKNSRVRKPDQLPKKEEGGIINYEGQTHQGPDGGIPIDEVGNPSAMSSNPPVALVEKGEVAFSHPEIGTYIFSNKLKYDNKKTFADKAKDIQRKYKLRMKDGKIIDSISEIAYNKEMLSLMKDQEIYREISGINKEERIKEQFKNMGMPIENNILPIGENGIYIKPNKRSSYTNYLKKNPNLNELLINSNTDYPKKDYGSLANTTVGLGEAVLPAIAATIGNFILANRMRKRKIEQIQAPQIVAPKVDSSSLRNSMMENALAQEAQIRRNALLTGTSPGQSLQNINMTSNELNRNLNEQLSKSYISDQEINAKNKLQADLANMEAKLQAEKINMENRLLRDQAIDTLRSNTANAWAQAFTEYLKGKKEFSALNMQTPNYQLTPQIRDKYKFIDILFPTLKKTVNAINNGNINIDTNTNINTNTNTNTNTIQIQKPQ